jgi:hypothetical protein
MGIKTFHIVFIKTIYAHIVKCIPMYNCEHLYLHTWEEEAGGAYTLHVSHSCKYYWSNPDRIRDFVSQYGTIRYYWTYSLEGQMKIHSMGDSYGRPNTFGLCGHSAPASVMIKSFYDTFPTHTDSKNFPYSFNPNTVCKGCKFYLK